jgi:hypothetical protein
LSCLQLRAELLLLLRDQALQLLWRLLHIVVRHCVGT